MTKQVEDIPALARPATANGIATAPGDLPMPDIERRFADQRLQFRHDNTILPLAPLPDEPVIVEATSGSGMHLGRASIFFTIDGSEPTVDSVQVPLEIASVDWDVRTGFLTRWRGRIPGQAVGTIVRYRIGGWHTGTSHLTSSSPDVWAHDGQGFWFNFPGEDGIITFAYSPQPARNPLPGWMYEAVIYHIFLDRFHPGTDNGAFPPRLDLHGRHGGTLNGVRQSLPYLAELGVTCLWLSPLHPSDTYHRYDGKDYFDVDPEVGTKEDLRALTTEAHSLDMRVLLDFVPSHCSSRHPAFEAARLDPSAPTASWFTFDQWPDRYRCFLQVARNLPSFNTNDSGARAYIIDSAVHWLKEYGVDGYRLDHVIAPSMDFWTAFNQAVENAKLDVVTIGEATDTPDCLRRYRGRLHGILDFPLARAFRLTFAVGSWSVGEFDAFLDAYEHFMHDGPGHVSFLDNHDMERFLYLAGGDTDRLMMGALCQFSLGATPVIYYGTEIGLSQVMGFETRGFGGDTEARHDMPWDEQQWNHNLLTFYRQLIRVRRQYPALWRGKRHTIHLNNPNGTYAYLRSLSGEQVPHHGDVLAVFNLSAAPQVVPLPSGSGTWAALLSTRDTIDLQADAVTLPSRSGAFLVVR